MASLAFVVQVLPGKLDDWKEFHNQLDGLRRWDFEDQQRRVGLERHRVWLQDTPEGPVALVVQEGEEPERAHAILAASSHPFDVWFKEQVMELHGVDLIAAADDRGNALRRLSCTKRAIAGRNTTCPTSTRS